MSQGASARSDFLTNSRIAMRLSLYIPLPRLILSETDLDKPIPALSERQFVVDKTRGTDEEERNLKTLFWYKQALLSQINVAWAEVSDYCKSESSFNVIDSHNCYSLALCDEVRSTWTTILSHRGCCRSCERI